MEPVRATVMAAPTPFRVHKRQARSRLWRIHQEAETSLEVWAGNRVRGSKKRYFGMYLSAAKLRREDPETEVAASGNAAAGIVRSKVKENKSN